MGSLNLSVVPTFCEKYLFSHVKKVIILCGKRVMIRLTRNDLLSLSR